MPGDRAVGVSERFQRRDLRSLQCERTRQRNMQDECGDCEEYSGHQKTERLELRQFVVECPRRHLERLWNRPAAAIWPEQTVQPRDYVGLGGIGGQRHRHVIEAAFHVETVSY